MVDEKIKKIIRYSPLTPIVQQTLKIKKEL